ncbi:MAG: alpha/beta hydrolase [Spirochaetales bacterium]|nr:alpha/beta hydrolase [Spirochaetales bacterium]
MNHINARNKVRITDRNTFLLITGLFTIILFSCSRTITQDTECAERARKFLSLLVNKEYTGAVSMYNILMKNSLPEDRLARVWEDTLDKVGEYENEIVLNQVKDGQFTWIFMTCKFTYVPLDIKLVFNPRKQITGLWFLPPFSAYDTYRAPDYADPELFTENEIVFGYPEWKLPGTLSLPEITAGPETTGPVPAVLLVHGSGPQDRDETVGPNKPFKDIAWGLASNQIAVLRYEKRTKRYPVKSAEIRKFTVFEETINDVVAAVSFLKTRKEINPDMIFILGHSLGGMLIPRIALKQPHVAGFIILAGPTRPLELLLLEQTGYISMIDGEVSDDEKEQIQKLKQKIARLKQGELSYDTPPEELPLDIPAAYWLDLKGYMPHIIASEISLPFLILQGRRDYQVTEKDFLGWKNALKTKSNATLILYDNLNHLFIPGKGKSIPSEYFEEGHVDKKVIDDITSWIKTIH